MRGAVRVILSIGVTCIFQEGPNEPALRWKFCVDQDAKCQAARAEKLRRIDAWWKAFEARKADLEDCFERQKRWDVPAWMKETLQAIDGRLMWEFGPGLKGGHRLVITPESDSELRPMVETVIERAPKIERWEFYSYRPAEGVAAAEARLKGRNLRSIARTKVLVVQGEHNFVNLSFSSPEYSGPEDEQALHSVFVAAEALLGEQVLNTWIGAIGVNKDGDDTGGLIALDRMAAAVESEIAAIKQRLPEKPFSQLPRDAARKRVKQELERDQRNPSRSDFLRGASMHPAMCAAAGAAGRFYSERFSRNRELFCYLKVHGGPGKTAERVINMTGMRKDLDAALDGVLRESGSGAVIGGGEGTQYLYVDLALTDVPAGIERVVKALREKVTNKAWIIFCDDTYGHEWIGIRDDSPPPPRAK